MRGRPVDYRDNNVVKYSIGPVKYTVSEEGYYVIEPKLTPQEAAAAEAIAEYLARKGVDINTESLLDAAKKLGLEDIVERNLDKLSYYISKRLSVWGFLYPLILDKNLEDISIANGALYIRHRKITSKEYIPVVGVKPPSEGELRDYAQRLAAAYGSAVNPAFPISEFDAEGRRVTIVLGSIASSTTINIRIHPEKPLSLRELIENNTLSLIAAKYLLQILYNRGAIFIVGPQGSGKTTLVNALLDELPDDWKIVVIEDVPEIRLVKHRHWVSLRIRRTRSLAASREVEVTYRDLIRAALRMGGQVTSITEARGEEVKELLEVAALGEAVVATFHARDWSELRQRLLLLGVSDQHISLLWAVVVMSKIRVRGGSVARRVARIYEVLPDATEHIVFDYDYENDELRLVEPPKRIPLPHVLE